MKNHIKNNDFWSNLPNWIDFRLLPKNSKNLFGHFRHFFAIISFFWPFQIKDRPQNINFHSTKNSRSPLFASKLPFSPPFSPPSFFNFVVFRTYVTQFKWGQLGLGEIRSHINADIRSHISDHIQNHTKTSQNHVNLGSFKLSYVSPENDKIGKSGWWKLGRIVEFGGEKQASRIFVLMKIYILRSIFNLERSKK